VSPDRERGPSTVLTRLPNGQVLASNVFLSGYDGGAAFEPVCRLLASENAGPGPIGLRCHAGKIRSRSIRVRRP